MKELFNPSQQVAKDALYDAFSNECLDAVLHRYAVEEARKRDKRPIVVTMREYYKNKDNHNIDYTADALEDL
jgi:hypothetical protein